MPVHVIMGAADIQQIKTSEPAVLGKNLDPGAEFTLLDNHRKLNGVRD